MMITRLTSGGGTRFLLTFLFLTTVLACTPPAPETSKRPDALGDRGVTPAAATSSRREKTVERAKELVAAQRALISHLEAERKKPAASEVLESLRGDVDTDTTGASMLRRLAERKGLVWKSKPAQVGGRTCCVLVFNPAFKSWPGSQPQTVVLTDDEYRLLTWKEVGGSPMYHSAKLEKKGEATVLAITCSHRHGPRGTYRYTLSLKGIARIGDIEWHKSE